MVLFRPRSGNTTALGSIAYFYVPAYLVLPHPTIVRRILPEFYMSLPQFLDPHPLTFPCHTPPFSGVIRSPGHCPVTSVRSPPALLFPALYYPSPVPMSLSPPPPTMNLPECSTSPHLSPPISTTIISSRFPFVSGLPHADLHEWA